MHTHTHTNAHARIHMRAHRKVTPAAAAPLTFSSLDFTPIRRASFDLHSDQHHSPPIHSLALRNTHTHTHTRFTIHQFSKLTCARPPSPLPAIDALTRNAVKEGKAFAHLVLDGVPLEGPQGCSR